VLVLGGVVPWQKIEHNTDLILIGVYVPYWISRFAVFAVCPNV
jgi:hypothetical protein